jgi:hypothetical protein
MASLYEILTNSHDGEGLGALGRELGLSPAQTQAAVTALLPAISTGLKRSTATPDGLGGLFSVMGQQQDLLGMYDDQETAFGSQGVAAGNNVLSSIFGSPDVSRAVIDQAQKFSGVSSDILKKMLPVLAGILVSGLMRSGSTGASASPAQPAPSGGNLGDILGQIFGRELPGSPGASAGPAQQVPPAGGQPTPPPGNQPAPAPTDAGGQVGSDGDLLGSILREFEKGIKEGRIKPVIIGGGPLQIPAPDGQQGPTPAGSDAPQMPGDILGQILRDVLGGGAGSPGQMPQGRQASSPSMKELSDLSEQLGGRGGVGAAVFGDHFEVGRDVEKTHVDNIQNVFNRYFGAPTR